ncbi:ATP/GTP-binding protein [Acidithiobacillus thiooxidans]|uniref:GTP-binding protein n=1 Tax=Acidithiobacillus thiooxidans TaxID=930 RepID=UPI001C070687|nr:ATP/GTP-binding protein [Acidithiobacillus thiooxidans]MBU2839993.1 ATP/GTP-binding protein [Acidithiobacillus thiooxidans]MDR7926949.1 ATP/GTP-binding protein [Acidithiobacillus thiooxidans]MDX5934493.1 ATP/GTP-binding protein [Acidithiobacillus thiooxidans]
MREDNKIVFTGPVGAGKTTAISVLSDTPIISTDAQASDMTLNRKGHTTVAMDYGILKLDAQTKIHLYGTPGQERFDFMWEILTTGGLGLVLMLDNTRPNPKKDLHFFLHAFKDYIVNVPVVIGISKTDVQNRPGPADYANMLPEVTADLKMLNPIPPIFEIDGRKKEDIKNLVMALLYSIDPGIGDIL